MGRTLAINLCGMRRYPNGPAGWCKFPEAGSVVVSRGSVPCRCFDEPFDSIIWFNCIDECSWLGAREFRRYTQIARKTMTAHTTRQPTPTNISTIRSSPKIVVMYSFGAAHSDPMASSDPSAQWFTPSHTRSCDMQNSGCVHRKSAQLILESLTEVITILKPFVSVPQLSVTYLNVRKFVLVNSAPTDCFVSLQVKSALCVPTACAPSYTYKWSLQSNCSISKRNINLCSIECVWNVITQFRFLSFLEESVAPSIFLYSCCKKWVLQIESMW